MARQRSGFRPRGSRGSRRLTEWGVGPGGTGVRTLTASGSAFLGNSIVLTEKGTIIRLRGFFSGTVQAASNLGDGFFGAMGIAVVQTPAFAAGIASVPTPIAEANSDAWLYHKFFDLRSGLTNDADGSGRFEVEVDSKAMRIMEGAEDSMYAAIETVEIGTFEADFFFDSRVLIKLG